MTIKTLADARRAQLEHAAHTINRPSSRFSAERSLLLARLPTLGISAAEQAALASLPTLKLREAMLTISPTCLGPDAAVENLKREVCR